MLAREQTVFPATRLLQRAINYALGRLSQLARGISKSSTAASILPLREIRLDAGQSAGGPTRLLSASHTRCNSKYRASVKVCCADRDYLNRQEKLDEG